MSNLYMTTEEFANMVVQALHDQNYFKRGTKAHPGDLVLAFTSTAESLATALEWAISKEAEVKKQAVMKTSNLSKVTYTISDSSSSVTFSPNHILPQDDEISPVVDDNEFDYSEWKYGRDQG